HLHGLVAPRGRHLAKAGIAEDRAGPVEMRRVGEIERFGAEFQVHALADTESPEDRGIYFEQSWTVQNVASEIAVGRRGRKHGSIEVQLAWSGGAEDPRRAVYVGAIAVARRIQARRAHGDVERQPAFPRPQPVELPVAQQPF